MLLCENCGKGFHTVCLKVEKLDLYFYCTACTNYITKIPEFKRDITQNHFLYTYL